MERDDYVAGGIGVFVVYVVVSRASLRCSSKLIWRIK